MELCRMSKMSRTKGANGEREVVSILRERGFDAKRSFFQIAGDREDVTGMPGYAIEVKRTESLSIWAALEQASNAAKATNTTPLLAFRRNRTEWQVALPLADFLDLMERAK
jgi:Holliday junction resolvase